MIPSDSLVALMRHARLAHAYVPAASASDAAGMAMYAAPRFELVRRSVAVEGKQRGIRRYLFRLRDP